MTDKIALWKKHNEQKALRELDKPKTITSSYIQIEKPKKSFWDYYDREISFGSNSEDALIQAREFSDQNRL